VEDIGGNIVRIRTVRGIVVPVGRMAKEEAYSTMRIRRFGGELGEEGAESRVCDGVYVPEQDG
jgi:hypothetical protein